MRRKTSLYLLLCAVLLGALPGFAEWYKGAMHVHSLRSDGDTAPEMPVSWYKEHGWNFVVVTEHNQLQTEERFRPITTDKAPKAEHVAALREKFGEEWVQVDEKDGQQRLRLKTFDEVRACFDEPGRFLMIQGEEITTIGGGPHVGATNVVEQIPARGDENVVESARLYFDTVKAQSESSGRPMLAVLNHPNFADAVTIEEMLQLPEYRFFEVFNGHPSVNNWGHPDKGYPSTDRFWDVMLAYRLCKGVDNPLYGTATDDAHDYQKWQTGEANPGRGWVMVNAASLEANALIESMEAGNFYASTGVTVTSIMRDANRLSLEIAGEAGVSYQTKFVGTRKGCSLESREYVNEKGESPKRASRVYSDEIGALLKETTGLKPEYQFAGDELYVRAVVISDKPKANPFREGDVEMAWVQPVSAR